MIRLRARRARSGSAVSFVIRSPRFRMMSGPIPDRPSVIPTCTERVERR
nr:MAG TPA: hypothetical protein [Caudoviricetes sp.]